MSEPNAEQRDILFDLLETQAAEYNRSMAYHPTSTDLGRAYKSAEKRKPPLVIALLDLWELFGALFKAGGPVVRT